MLGKTFSFICILSLGCAAVGAKIPELAASVLSGASGAVSLTLSLVGMMGLWNGVMELLREVGAIDKLARRISPILKTLFPCAYHTGNGIRECCANIAANLLGIGNAATPLAISALEKMQLDNPEPSVATDDQITLAVMNSASVNIMPVTLIAIRTAAGSSAPYAVLIPVWICSALGCVFAVLFSKLFARVSKNKRGRRQ